MGLFSKKTAANLEVIRHEFDENEIAFRYPQDDFSSGSVLLVQPGQEAVMIKDGDQDGPYTNGRYTLETNHLPGISKFINSAYQGGSVFNCYIYFVNKEKPVYMFWGTPHPLMVRDGETAREVRMMANGSMAFTISNSLRFIAKTNGQLHSYSVENIGDFLFEKSVERITSALASEFDVLEQQRLPVKRIQSQAAQISDGIKARIITERLFDEYGLTLKEFAIKQITMNAEDEAALREDQNSIARRKREADIKYYETRSQGAAEADVMWAKGKAESDVMKEKGEYYTRERMYDVLQSAAQNEGGINGGGLVGAGIGLGVGMGVGSGFGSAIGNVAGNAFASVGRMDERTAGGVKCPGCGTVNGENAKFCSGCGEKLIKAVACPKCGAENSAGAKFCAQCGTSLLPEKTKCPQCGKEIDKDVKFCPFCGAAINK